MAIASTATDMPQNKLYENNNLGTAEVVRGGRLTTGEYQICCAIISVTSTILRADGEVHGRNVFATMVQCLGLFRSRRYCTFTFHGGLSQQPRRTSGTVGMVPERVKAHLSRHAEMCHCPDDNLPLRR